MDKAVLLYGCLSILISYDIIYILVMITCMDYSK
jgi:hypothetical protein